MSTRSIRSYREASRYSGVPITSLRDAIARGDVPQPVMGTDGKSVWDVGALDALRAARGQGAPSSGAVAAPSPVSATVNTPSASSTRSVSVPPAAPPTALAAVTSGWLLAPTPAVPGLAHVDSEDEDDEDDVQPHAPPFWAASSAPTYSDGHPVVDPVTRVITYVPSESSTAGAHAPGTVGAFVAELQQQLAVTQAQLAAATAAWRRERVAAIAAEIAAEALTSGTLPQVAAAARDAARTAAAGLSDNELSREDGYPQAVARGAGMIAAQQLGASIAWQAQQQPWPPPRDPNDELSRARARRRSRSPRW